MDIVDDIEFKIVKKRSLKHTYIYIKDAKVEIRAPFSISDHKIYELIRSKRDWIKKSLKKSKSTKEIEFGTKEDAKRIILPLVDKWSKKMGLTPSFVGFRDNKSRWGSCSSKNRINFNTKLVNMPIEFVEYVVVHELAHIKHKNHSKEFWDEVKRYLPDFKERKKLIL